MWEIWVQQLFNGLSAGMAYALVALGLTLIFGVLHVINFAHGEFYLMGGLGLVVIVQATGIPYPVAVLGAVIVAAAVSWIVDRVVVRDVVDRPGGFSTVLLATYAVSLLVSQAVFFTWGSAPQRVDGIPGILEIGGVTITYQRLVVVFAGMAVLVVLDLVLRRSALGRETRAVAQDAFAARVVGIDVRRVRTVTFVISGAIAGLAGALLTPISLFSPHMGEAVLIKAFVVVVIGGMGNVGGAVVAGVSLGLLEAILGRFIAPGFALALIYSLLVAVLLVRPNGLLSPSR